MPEPMSREEFDDILQRVQLAAWCHNDAAEFVALGAARAAYAALLANNERLQGLLAKYGNHKPDCECITPLTAGYGTKCTCGFTVALRGKEEHNV